MKNFSEALDTDRRIEIICELEPIVENGYPKIVLCINGDVLYNGELKKYKKIKKYLDINDLIEFEVKMEGKKYDSDKETACLIKNISVEGIQIIPKYQHLIDYKNDHNHDIKTNYLGYNGHWKLVLCKPFYIWNHEISGQGFLVT